MDTRVFTVIETDKSEDQSLRFEWYGGRTVNVINTSLDCDVDTFGFTDQPDIDKVVLACEGYFEA